MFDTITEVMSLMIHVCDDILFDSTLQGKFHRESNFLNSPTVPLRGLHTHTHTHTHAHVHDHTHTHTHTNTHTQPSGCWPQLPSRSCMHLRGQHFLSNPVCVSRGGEIARA